MQEVKGELSQIFFNDILRVASQYETRSNVTAVEWDLRKSESLVMLGPVLERIDFEVLKPIIERVFAIANRAGILPPPPKEISGAPITITFVSMLTQAQQAAAAQGIERLLGVAGNIIGIDPAAADNVDFDFALEKYSSLLNNDPKLIRAQDALAKIRADRAQQQRQQQQAAIAQQLSQGAANLSKADLGNGQNALQAMMQQGGPSR